MNDLDPNFAIPPSSDSRNWAMLCHLSALLAMMTLGAGIVAQAAIWFWKKEDDEFIRDQGKEALNFSTTMVLAWVVCLALPIIGYVFIAILTMVWFIFAIIGAVNASKGQRYRYPLSLRLIS